MSNLFSIFSPQALMGYSLNWLSSILVVLFLFSRFWFNSNFIFETLSFANKSILSEINSLGKSWSHSEISFIPMIIMFTIFLNNFMGLFPYIFTSSSHLVFTMSLALPLWVGHMIMGMFKTTNSMLAHLVPLGTPVVLMPFMVLIEVVSNLIRPLTLSVRLAANMTAGHLLLCLLGSSISSISVFLLLLIILLMLCILEMAVSMIQSYVFSVLSSLYLNEVDSLSIRKYY